MLWRHLIPRPGLHSWYLCVREGRDAVFPGERPWCIMGVMGVRFLRWNELRKYAFLLTHSRARRRFLALTQRFGDLRRFPFGVLDLCLDLE